MFNNQNGRPVFTNKKTVQLMVILTVLAWMTQTLFHQWGWGQEVSPAAQPAELPKEKFVPGDSHFGPGATLEVRPEATVLSAEVKLKQVCRWSDAEAATFAPIADLVLFRLAERAPFRSISVEEIRGTLHDAGVNLAMIRFAGATACTVARGDVKYDEHTALQQWIDARQGNAPPADVTASETPTAAGTAATSASTAAAVPSTGPASVDASQYHTLRELLTNDIATRLQVPIDALQMTFNPADEKLLNLAEPHFRFSLQATRVRNLGDVAWQVAIVTDTGTQKASVAATARMWQNQVVLMKPVSFKQVIRDEDIVERRTLVDHLSDEPLLAKSQLVGEQAARELKPGVIFTSRMVEAVQMVRAGQFVTITLNQGAVQIKSVAKAMEGGSFGQTIKVRNDSTKDMFEVIITGPQQARMGSEIPPAMANAAATGE